MHVHVRYIFGVIGVYHHTSRKHLGRYVNEFTFRLNDGNVKRQTLDRLDSFIAATRGRGSCLSPEAKDEARSETRTAS